MQSKGMGHAWDTGPRGDKCRVIESVISWIPRMP